MKRGQARAAVARDTVVAAHSDLTAVVVAVILILAYSGGGDGDGY
jgi:hypothetical protein